MLEATLQVLVATGKERLTTTRVAARAGVSVGTLYQYFPNKRSLLQAVLRRHFAGVFEAVERVCAEQRGAPLVGMGTALAQAFLTAKMHDGKSSVALYAVASDVEGVEVAQQMGQHAREAICGLLRSAPERVRDPELVATVLQGVMSGVSRQLLESDDPEQRFAALERELVTMVGSYLATQM